MTNTSLAQVSWRSHLRAVLAIAKKDSILFFRYPLNALFRVIEPIAWLTPAPRLCYLRYGIRSRFALEPPRAATPTTGSAGSRRPGAE